MIKKRRDDVKVGEEERKGYREINLPDDG